MFIRYVFISSPTPLLVRDLIHHTFTITFEIFESRFPFLKVQNVSLKEVDKLVLLSGHFSLIPDPTILTLIVPFCIDILSFSVRSYLELRSTKVDLKFIIASGCAYIAVRMYYTICDDLSFMSFLRNFLSGSSS